MKKQEAFYDIPTSTLSPIQIREKLAEVAQELLQSNELAEFKELLKNKSTPNGGVSVTDDLKYTSALLSLSWSILFVLSDFTVKFSRQNGVHVSPTVLWDGLIAGEISSSWADKEWNEFLAAKVAV
jgi:hypothetical protein